MNLLGAEPADHLQRFAERAWRRSVKSEELKNYLDSYHADREAGEKAVTAYRNALLRVLTSRNFIYLVEGDPVARKRLTDSELASRLSYFLWSSMPDDALFIASKTGPLIEEDLKKHSKFFDENEEIAKDFAEKVGKQKRLKSINLRVY